MDSGMVDGDVVAVLPLYQPVEDGTMGSATYELHLQNTSGTKTWTLYFHTMSSLDAVRRVGCAVVGAHPEIAHFFHNGCGLRGDLTLEESLISHGAVIVFTRF